MPDFSRIDFTMPKGLTHDERVAWLHEIGAQLRTGSGQKSGSTQSMNTGGQQPTWFLWWGGEDDSDLG